MIPVIAAKVWHYWIAVPLVASGVLMSVALGVGYLRKVAAHRPPRQ